MLEPQWIASFTAYLGEGTFLEEVKEHNPSGIIRLILRFGRHFASSVPFEVAERFILKLKRYEIPMGTLEHAKHKVNEAIGWANFVRYHKDRIMAHLKEEPHFVHQTCFDLMHMLISTSPLLLLDPHQVEQGVLESDHEELRDALIGMFEAIFPTQEVAEAIKEESLVTYPYSTKSSLLTLLRDVLGASHPVVSRAAQVLHSQQLP